MKSISDFERINFGILPTPLHRLNNISNLIGKNIYIKRDDMTGVALGGNKVRKLEFLLADAKSKGCDYVITTGGAQSNHAMLTAACANRIDMKSKLMLMGRGIMERKGNLILNELLGADVSFIDTDDFADVNTAMEKEKQRLAAEGYKAYLVPLGGSVPLGSLGYVNCFNEMTAQATAMRIKIDHIIDAVGSGGTIAGLMLGADISASHTKVTGIAVGEGNFSKSVADLMSGTAKLLEIDESYDSSDVDIFEYFGDGYAIPSSEGNAAMDLMARKEGLILDPVYTGKAFAGLLKLNEDGYFDGEENIVFIYSGGAGGLFAF